MRSCRHEVRSARDTALANHQAARFGVRLFKCLPSIAVLRVDHVLYWGPYLAGRANQQCPVVRVEAGGFLFDQIVEHFERIWSDNQRSREVPEAWLEDLQPVLGDESGVSATRG